jgi:signal transduction histidine kinase
MSPLDLPAALGKVAALLDAELKLACVELTVEVVPRLPATLADSVMIEQVVHNLTKNAIEAMRGQSSPRRLRLGARVDPTGQIEVSVRDSGPGVPEAARDQLFSHFFTSKPDGLGIGLNICRSIIEFHGGALFYDHPPGGGCRFCFTLPVQAA